MITLTYVKAPGAGASQDARRCEAIRACISGGIDEMGSEYRIRHLARTEIHRAFPLIQVAYPDLTMSDWIRFAAAQVDGTGGRALASGIVSVERKNGYLHGIFTYVVNDDALAGRVLTCDHFVVLDFLSRNEPFTALLKAAEKLCIENNCTRTLLCIPTPWTAPDIPESPVVKLLHESGFDCDSLRFLGGASRGGLSSRRSITQPDPEVNR